MERRGWLLLLVTLKGLVIGLTALGVLLLRASLEPVVTAALVLGGVLAVVWELGEYVTFIRTNEEELETAYTDTIADLTFDMVGASIAAGIIWWLARRRPGGAPRVSPGAARL